MHHESRSEEYNIRLQKMQTLQELGHDPYTPRASKPRTLFSKDLIEQFTNPESIVEGTIAGRVMLKRDFGKAAFITIRDEEGDIQIYLKKDILGENIFEIYKLLDLGDIISVSGKMFFTQKGEPTLEVHHFQILTKALSPLPEKFHGLEDIETRYRKRYLDLIANPEVRKNFVLRSHLVQYLREYLSELGFLEVDTPILQSIHGGALAKPFITHHNALDMELYLRIAPELFLKRVVIGGMHKVYEVSRNFRNEGIDTTHNPEFTQVEIYEAYSDWRGMVDLFVDLMKTLSLKLFNSTTITYQGQTVDISKWKEISYSDALRSKGIDPDKITTREEAVKIAEKYNIPVNDDMGRWGIFAELFDLLVSDYIMEPTVVYDYPAEISPLSKRHPNNPEIAERFEAYAFGMEVCNGFSELNNPLTQEQVFADQIKRKENGNEETMGYDGDYIQALEQGLPPTGGIGIGIDRISMIFLDTTSIRDVLLFPTMKKSQD